MITILDITRRLLNKSENDTISMADTSKCGLPFMGGCYGCGATIHAGNMCPTRNDFVCCKQCMTDAEGNPDANSGFKTVGQAIEFMWPNRKVPVIFDDTEYFLEGGNGDLSINYANEDVLVLSFFNEQCDKDTIIFYSKNCSDTNYEISNVMKIFNYDINAKFDGAWFIKINEKQVSQEPELHVDF